MKSPMIERFALSGSALVPATANPGARTIDCQFLSGLPIQRVAWDGRPFELIFDPDGADLSRLSSGAAPLLNSHQDRPLSAQIGIVERAWREGATFKARIRFSARVDVEPIWQDVLAGTLRGVSGGFNIIDWADEETGGQLVRRTATKWEALEMSLVSIPADPAAVTLAWNGEHDMNTQTQTGAAAPAPAHDRITQTLNGANLGAEFNVRLLATNPTPEQASAACLEEMARRASTHETRVGVSFITRDSADTTREGMTEALMARCNGKAPAEIGRQWHGRRIVDLARELLIQRGVRTFGSDSQLVNAALMHSTSDFPNLLAGLANKVLLNAYTVAESDLKQCFRRSTASDFRTKYVTRRGEFPALALVPEGAQYTQGTMGEAKEAYALSTYGKIFSITRQMLINDDLGAFNDTAAAIGSACADFEANLLVNLVTANSGAGPVMSDGYNLFDNTHHGNSGGGVIGVTALDAARTAMRTQKGIDGATIIDARPRFLVVPAAKETTGEQALSAIAAVDPEKVNPFSGKLQLVAEPRFDAKSTARWYMISDPAILPFAEYSYLSGSEGPDIEQQVGFDIDGLQVKCRLDFGCAAIDWRGAFVSTGS